MLFGTSSDEGIKELGMTEKQSRGRKEISYKVPEQKMLLLITDTYMFGRDQNTHRPLLPDMKLLSLSALAVAVSATVLRRAPTPGECVSIAKFRAVYHGIYDASCYNMVAACEAKQSAECTSEVVAALGQTGLPHLNYNIYAGIVGDCAWQEGGCPITQQNYIDFYYGALSEINTNVWPDWWGYIKDWAATGETVPYTNFDDWLHYSNSS
ncbi:hypothetical protein MPER_07205 [Moniliophthora perniciosa FA553]|nr:hypothetical protein MPER_07205 [Moniliophthora perniciosa FA553]